MAVSGWGNFWQEQKSCFDTVMKIATTYFAVALEEKLNLKPGDKILDYGCGPGFLADLLEPKGISITGADISKSYITQYKINHPDSLTVLINANHVLNKTLLEEQLKKNEFDFIVLLSISQYLESVSELEGVIRLLVPFAKDQGKIIVADVVDQNSSAVNDAFSLFTQCIRNRQPLAFFRFISYVLFSNYRKISKNSKLLKISESSFRQIAAENHLSCEKVTGLTIHRRRLTYILSKTK